MNARRLEHLLPPAEVLRRLDELDALLADSQMRSLLPDGGGYAAWNWSIETRRRIQDQRQRTGEAG